MTWLKTDDKYPEHRKVRRLSDAAYRLHHTAMCACARDETDGLVTETDIEDMEHGKRLRKHVPHLVEAGLWDEVRGGWVIHDYLHYNPSHEQLNAKRAADRERQINSRKRRAMETGTEPASSTDMSRRDNGVTGVVSHTPVPSRPDPTRKDSESTLHGIATSVARETFADAMPGASR